MLRVVGWPWVSPQCISCALSLKCMSLSVHKSRGPQDVRTILLSIQSLLEEPNINSPLNTHAAELGKTPIALNKYLQETCSKQVSSQEPCLASLLAFSIFSLDGLSFPSFLSRTLCLKLWCHFCFISVF
ncbi:unnamed protein product [Nyctereutes procyonoides]|uniref:(raccoon dog) hypothetical protein n=1 Tax=Nyctereutes procyonoides TaxID=34880 RepID=A0A811Z1J6_NYCPR|nr:unnamed protein product [Nyctereutes procyonoides]